MTLLSTAQEYICKVMQTREDDLSLNITRIHLQGDPWPGKTILVSTAQEYICKVIQDKGRRL